MRDNVGEREVKKRRERDVRRKRGKRGERGTLERSQRRIDEKSLITILSKKSK